MRTVSQHLEAVCLPETAVLAVRDILENAAKRGATKGHLDAIRTRLGVVGVIFIKCPMNCGTEPKGKTDLVDHINAVHLKYELACNHCSEIRYTPKKLRTHIKSKRPFF